MAGAKPTDGPAIDLMADVGEGYGRYRVADDDALLEVISSANVACGFHAGDPRTLDATVAACRRTGVALGAHPGLPDVVGFGRRAIELERHEVMTDVLYQLGALAAFAKRHAVSVQHVTPHGKLGELARTNPRYADGVVDAVLAFDSTAIVAAQEGELARRARERGLAVAVIGFADRAYDDDGAIVSRAEPDAVIHDPDVVAERVIGLAKRGTVRARSGREVPVPCDTVLLHGDTEDAASLARRVRVELIAAGVRIAPLVEQET